MKTKLILIILCTTCIISKGLSQVPVWDVACMETLIENHKAQYNAFKEMKKNEGKIAAIQAEVSRKITQIEYYKAKVYKSLKDVKMILKTGKDIIYAKDIIKDIVKYQSTMIQESKDNPELTLVAVETEAELIKRTRDLIFYIYNVAVVGTDFNLLNNKQRMDLIYHVISELRIMRGIAYSICVQLKSAKRSGVLKILLRQHNLDYGINFKSLANDIMRDLEYLKLR